MAADLLRAVAGHEADDQAADDRNEHRPHAEMMTGGRREFPDGNALVVEEISEEADQLGERQRDERAGHTDEHRHEGNNEDSGVSGEIPPVCVGNGRHVPEI